MPSVASYDFLQRNINAALDGIYSSVILRDVVERNRITDQALLRKLVLFLADNIGNLTSPNNIGNVLVYEGELDEGKRKRNPASKTISNYINALEKAYVFYGVGRARVDSGPPLLVLYYLTLSRKQINGSIRMKGAGLMPTKSSRSSSSIYQMKITLQGSRPPIWRRVLVPGNFNLYKLHQVIQVAMGWTDSHLHQFDVDGDHFGIPSSEDYEPVKDERRVTLEKIAPSLKSKFIYEYDFGDSWTHQVVVEKILTPVPGETYPQCIAGKRACPPEDVGGVWGYEDFLESLRDPEHEEHESNMEWLGEEFDPEAFDPAEVNDSLSRLK